jgi:hypothetical protein
MDSTANITQVRTVVLHSGQRDANSPDVVCIFNILSQASPFAAPAVT